MLKNIAYQFANYWLDNVNFVFEINQSIRDPH